MIFSITVTFNPELDLLTDQLYALENQVDKIIIIDNNSKNINDIKSVFERLSLEFKEKIEIIELTENYGLAKAQNIALNLVKKDNVKKVLMLDQDSIPAKDLVNILDYEMDTIIKSGVKVSAVGPIYYDGKTKELYPATKYVGPFIKRIKPSSHPVEVTFTIASGSLILIDSLEEIGLMNEDFFIDYIDVEWCLRAKTKGFSCFIVPKAKMIHTIGDNRMNFFGRKISIHSPLRRYYLIRNSFIISRLNYIPFGYKFRELFFNFIRFFIFIVISNEKKQVLKFSLQGFFDGIKGRKGKKYFS